MMKQGIDLSKITLIVLLCHCPQLWADFKAGGDAYKQGDFETAAQEFLKSAVKGDHRAMYALGSMYAGGQGVDLDYKQAYTWFRKAAKYGRPDAQYKLGLMYEQGLGLKQDDKKALRWYGKAAKSGYVFAQYKVGLYYAHGLGIEQDNMKAYAWLLVAGNKLKAASAETVTIESEEDIDKQLLEQQQAFKQGVQSLKLADLKSQLTGLKAKLTEEELQRAKELAIQYNRY